MENSSIESFFNSFHISEAEKIKMLELDLFKILPKGTFLLKEGDITKYNYFVLKGCLREYHLKDGIEKTIEFYLEENAIFSQITLNGKYSASYIICEEDCNLLRSSQKDEPLFRTDFPAIERICNVLTQKEIAKHQSKYSNYVISSPEERYLDILENKPYLLHRFSQYHIASYIGVKPESLSRIKKRITKKP